MNDSNRTSRPRTGHIGRRGPVVLAIAVSLLLAACSGPDDDDAAPANDENIAADGAMVGGSGTEGDDSDTGADGENGPADQGDAGADSGYSGVEIDPELDGTDGESPDPIIIEDLPDVLLPDLAQPEDLLPELEAKVGEAVKKAAESPDVAILDVADLPDTTPTADEVAAFGDGHPRTSSGRLIVLDEVASLACANVEIALGAIDEGATATAKDHIASAGERSGRSEVASIESWSHALTEAGSGQNVDATTLVGFLSVCIEGGYAI